ncbi:MAG: magnesium transporter [Deltaproteobacteria bacterium]|nr:magnesium transporter [Deltaproteobacteria bacterium]
MITKNDHLKQPVMTAARKDFATLYEGFSIQQALDDVRSRDIGEKIVYFYVVDREGRLSGVVPTRRLLSAPLDQRLSEVMIRRVIAIPQEATVLDALEFFAMHKLLAFPVVDQHRQITGVVDVSVFTDEVFDMTERERMEEVFELIGFHVSQVRGASPLKAFRFRFMWLLATIGSGTICAFLASAYETTLAKSIILAFFLTMVLGLGESVSTQSMTVTIQGLRSRPMNLKWYLSAFWREAGTALLLGSACGLAVGLIVFIWHWSGIAAIAIGISVVLVIFVACLLGLSIPALLHSLNLDLKIAAGPMTLAMADIFTILIYLGLAAVLL